MPADPQLAELLDTIQERMNDAIDDLQAAVRCVQAYKNDPEGAQSCILTYLRTGESGKAILMSR